MTRQSGGVRAGFSLGWLLLKRAQPQRPAVGVRGWSRLLRALARGRLAPSIRTAVRLRLLALSAGVVTLDPLEPVRSRPRTFRREGAGGLRLVAGKIEAVERLEPEF